jgi:limonene-1,2-epoxide hydrolase
MNQVRRAAVTGTRARCDLLVHGTSSRGVGSSEVVSSFWERIQARDWEGLGRLLAEDFVVEWPDLKQRIRGRQNFVEFNRTYPEGWTIEVLGIIAEGETVVSEVRVPHAERGIFYVISVLKVEGDRIVSGREYWLKEHQEELPAERAHLFEPM